LDKPANQRPNGHVGRENRPERINPPLTLLAGVDDPPWALLEPDVAVYGLFAWALSQQDSWDREQHTSFWQASLPLWPRKRGNRQHTQRLAGWVAAARKDGATDDKIAAAFGYRRDDLRRMGVFALVDAWEAWLAATRSAEPERESPEILERRSRAARRSADRMRDEWLLAVASYIASLGRANDAGAILSEIEHVFSAMHPESPAPDHSRRYPRVAELEERKRIYTVDMISDDFLSAADRRTIANTDELGRRARAKLGRL